MLFGLHNASATFQRLMNQVACGLHGCVVYLDDVVIYSDTWEEHLDSIKALLDRLVWTRLLLTKPNVSLLKPLLHISVVSGRAR